MNSRCYFIHFCDLVFLHYKGLKKARIPSLIVQEMQTALRFAILMSDDVLIPAASYFESPICRSVLKEFDVLARFGIIRLIGGGINYLEFRQQKMELYTKEQEQGKPYWRLKKSPPYPWLTRELNTTDEIGKFWLSYLNSGGLEKDQTENKLAHGANCVKGIPDCFCQVGNAAS
jgi:hypothetical protein